VVADPSNQILKHKTKRPVSENSGAFCLFDTAQAPVHGADAADRLSSADAGQETGRRQLALILDRQHLSASITQSFAD
jgi:hypothetical protein